MVSFLYTALVVDTDGSPVGLMIIVSDTVANAYQTAVQHLKNDGQNNHLSIANKAPQLIDGWTTNWNVEARPLTADAVLSPGEVIRNITFG